MLKKVLVDESLLEASATSVEMANVYIAGLRAILADKCDTEEAKKLQLIAFETIQKAGDVNVLSTTEFES